MYSSDHVASSYTRRSICSLHSSMSQPSIVSRRLSNRPDLIGRDSPDLVLNVPFPDELMIGIDAFSNKEAKCMWTSTRPAESRYILAQVCRCRNFGCSYIVVGRVDGIESISRYHIDYACMLDIMLMRIVQ